MLELISLQEYLDTANKHKVQRIAIEDAEAFYHSNSIYIRKDRCYRITTPIEPVYVRKTKKKITFVFNIGVRISLSDRLIIEKDL